MHDPMTMIYSCRWFTLWHKDPERDGTDDSCGWFMRARHGNQTVLDRIVRRFEFDWDRVHEGDNGHVYHCGWFKPNGQPHFSPVGITVGLFHAAAGVAFSRGDRFNWKAAECFVQSHLAEIIRFAENPTDSLHDGITRKFEIGCGEEYTERRRQERIRSMASCIYGWILRANCPWYRHPRWHVRHWRFQVPLVQNLKRWLFSRCAVCGKRFPWGYAPVSRSWDGPGPRWFRGEPGVCHHGCGGAVVARAHDT